MARKAMSLGQAETARQRAVEMLRRFGRDDDAERFEAMDAQEYLEHKGIALTPNPKTKLRSYNMAQTGPTKVELEDILDEVTGILEDAYDPTISREEMAQKIADALDTIEGEDEDEDEDQDEGEDGPDLGEA